MSAETVEYLTPEFLLVLAASLVYLVGAFLPGRIWNWVALASMIVAGTVLVRVGGMQTVPGPVAADRLADYGRWFALIAGGLLLLTNWRGSELDQVPEFVGSLMLATAGVMLTASATDLVLIFIGLELLSLPTYVMLYLGRPASGSREAAAKYFFLSILSSGFLLYGFSFLYGIAGSTHLPALQATLLGQGEHLATLVRLAPLAICLVIAGLGFRLAAVPFQFYAPDVYQGTSHGNAALLSVFPKAAGMLVLVRLIGFTMPGQEALGWRLAMILGALSMTVGNLLALWQSNLRRLLAYSSIAHVGYMMIGVATGFAVIPTANTLALDGFGAMLFYLALYSVATIGTFAVFQYLAGRDHPVETIDDLAGVWKSHPVIAISLAVFMFSLAGIPILAGFWGKLTLFFSALSVSELPQDHSLRRWFIGLAVLGVVNAAIAAAYYLRIISTVVFRDPVVTARPGGGWAPWTCAVGAAAATIALGLLPGPLMRESNDAVVAGRPQRPIEVTEMSGAGGSEAPPVVQAAVIAQDQ